MSKYRFLINLPGVLAKDAKEHVRQIFGARIAALVKVWRGSQKTPACHGGGWKFEPNESGCRVMLPVGILLDDPIARRRVI